MLSAKHFEYLYCECTADYTESALTKDVFDISGYNSAVAHVPLWHLKAISTHL